MKTLILAAIRCSLILAAVAALSVAYPAKANTINTFNVSGTCTPIAPFTGTTFAGTITIDVTAGSVTAIDISFQGLSPFNTIFKSQPVGTSDWSVGATNGESYFLSLAFTTGHTPGSLVGFTGGTIDSGSVLNPIEMPVYRVQSGGSITAAGVPDGGSTVSLLGFALLGLVALRRKFRC